MNYEELKKHVTIYELEKRPIAIVIKCDDYDNAGNIIEGLRESGAFSEYGRVPILCIQDDQELRVEYIQNLLKEVVAVP